MKRDMIDIVEWLRAEAELVALPRLAEAADDIERLRALDTELLGAAKKAVDEADKIDSTAKSRREAIIRLRAAIVKAEGKA